MTIIIHLLFLMVEDEISLLSQTCIDKQFIYCSCLSLVLFRLQFFKCFKVTVTVPHQHTRVVAGSLRGPISLFL